MEFPAFINNSEVSANIAGKHETGDIQVTTQCRQITSIKKEKKISLSMCPDFSGKQWVLKFQHFKC